MSSSNAKSLERKFQHQFRTAVRACVANNQSSQPGPLPLPLLSLPTPSTSSRQSTTSASSSSVHCSSNSGSSSGSGSSSSSEGVSASSSGNTSISQLSDIALSSSFYAAGGASSRAQSKWPSNSASHSRASTSIDAGSTCSYSPSGSTCCSGRSSLDLPRSLSTRGASPALRASSRHNHSKHPPSRRPSLQSTFASAAAAAAASAPSRAQRKDQCERVYKTSMGVDQVARVLSGRGRGGKQGVGSRGTLFTAPDGLVCLSEFGYLELLTMDESTADELGMQELEVYQFLPEGKSWVQTYQRKNAKSPWTLVGQTSSVAATSLTQLLQGCLPVCSAYVHDAVRSNAAHAPTFTQQQPTGGASEQAAAAVSAAAAKLAGLEGACPPKAGAAHMRSPVSLLAPKSPRRISASTPDSAPCRRGC